jgi:hypothetical protein
VAKTVDDKAGEVLGKPILIIKVLIFSRIVQKSLRNNVVDLKLCLGDWFSAVETSHAVGTPECVLFQMRELVLAQLYTVAIARYRVVMPYNA